MNKITKIFYYIFAILLPFGSINPFNISDVSSQITEQQGLAPYLFVICCFLSIFDIKIWSQWSKVRNFLIPLVFLFCSIFFAGIIYSISTSLDYSQFYLKLFIHSFGFIIISQYFITYPRVLNISLKLYSYTCAVIITLFFSGFLNGLFYYSNNRLWIFGINPNTFSFMMGLGMLFIAKQIYEGSYRKKAFLFLDILIIIEIFTYIILSGSRGTLVSASLCFVLIFYKLVVKKWYYAVPIAILSLFLIINYFRETSTINVSQRYEDSASFDDRERLIENAISLWADRPFCGFGKNGYCIERVLRFNDNRDSHNVVVSVMVMGGVIGLFAFLSFIVVLFKKISTNKANSHIPIVLFLYVFFMSMKTGDVLTYSLMWYAYAIVVGMGQLNKREQLTF